MRSNYIPNKSPVKHVRIADDEHKTKYTENFYYDMENDTDGQETIGSQHLKKTKSSNDRGKSAYPAQDGRLSSTIKYFDPREQMKDEKPPNDID